MNSNSRKKEIEPWKLIFGERLAIERKKLGYTQDKLAELLQVGSGGQVVSNWERGTIPAFETIMKLADLFNCDIDYLTGRLEEPTHDIAFIHAETGLSTAAIKKLHSNINDHVDSAKNHITAIILSKIIEHNDFDYLFNRVYQLIDKRSREEVAIHLKRLAEEKRDNGKDYLKLTELEDIIPIFDEVLNIKDERSVESLVQYQISNKFLSMIDDILKGKVGGPYE